MDFEAYSRTKLADYATLAETEAGILQAAIGAYPQTFRLQQVQHRPKIRNRFARNLRIAALSRRLHSKTRSRIWPAAG